MLLTMSCISAMQRESIFTFPLQQRLRERAKSLRHRLRLQCDGTRTETRFRLSAKRSSPFKSAGASVQSTTGSRGVRISGSNAGYTMFWGTVQDYRLPTPFASFPFTSPPCVTVCHHISTGVYLHCPSFFQVLATYCTHRITLICQS